MDAFFHNDIFLLQILYIHSASPNLKPFISRAVLKTEHHHGAPAMQTLSWTTVTSLCLICTVRSNTLMLYESKRKRETLYKLCKRLYLATD